MSPVEVINIAKRLNMLAAPVFESLGWHPHTESELWNEVGSCIDDILNSYVVSGMPIPQESRTLVIDYLAEWGESGRAELRPSVLAALGI